jgi:hypothetical protein
MSDKQFKLFGGTIKTALIHAATEYDRKAEARAAKRRQPFNHYSMSHYLARIDDVVQDVAKGAKPRAAIIAGFSGSICDAMLRAIGEPRHTESERGGSITYRPASEA